MTEQDDSRSRADRNLDALLRRAAAADEGSAEPFDESEVLEYLSGTADGEAARALRKRIVGSAAARRDVVEMGADVGRLQNSEARSAFDAQAPVLAPAAGRPAQHTAPDRAARRGERPSPLGWIASLFWKPAFAYAFTLAVLAYPTFRFATDRTAGSGNPIVSMRAVSLRADGGVVPRGGEAPARLEIPRGAGEALELTLWAERPPTPGEQVRVHLEGPAGILWTDGDSASLMEVGGDLAYRIVLNPDRLPEGDLSIRVEHVDASTGDVRLEQVYRLTLTD